MINAIVACDSSGGIGKDNGIPWPKIHEDLQYFKKQTSGHVVVMGSNTWNSKGMLKPLPNRHNVVVTTQNVLTPMPHTCIREHVIDQILELENKFSDKIIWIIGGANLLKQTKSIIDFWYITRINQNYKCDVFIDPIWEDEQHELIKVTVMDDIPVSLVPRFYHTLSFEVYQNRAKLLDSDND